MAKVLAVACKHEDVSLDPQHSGKRLQCDCAM